jgi:cytochrome P450
MKVLHTAILEVLRYYPVAMAMPRTAAATFDFAGYRIPESSNVTVAPAVTHSLPQFFPTPFLFSIDRYFEPHHEHHQANAFVPFALGEHAFLSADIAKVQIMANIATIVNAFDL